MSLPRYPEYRVSGIDWVEMLPAHWEVANLKWVCRRYSGGTPDKNRLEFWEDGTVPWLNSGAVNDGRIFEPSTYITREALASSSAKWIPAGALLMALAGQGKTKGMVAQLMFESTCNQSMAAIVPAGRVQARYLYWWLANNYQNIRNMAGGDLRDGLNLDLLGEIPCPLPSCTEQATIAAFLDGETAKIDALIVEQEKLLALLAEKRQATISHAVTRGLDPNAPMKDSGIPWLGEVPAHWEVRPLKSVVSTPITDGPHETPAFLDEGVPFVSAEAVSGGTINFDKIRGYISAEDDARYSQKYRPQLHDIYMVKSGATTGVTAIVDGRTDFNIWSPLAVIRCNQAIAHPYFVLGYLRSRNCQEGVALNWSFGTQQNIGMGVLGELPVALPPKEEQREIAEFLERKLRGLNALRISAEQAVFLLRERRSALIAAAVTGQIDVRGAMEPQAA